MPMQKVSDILKKVRQEKNLTFGQIRDALKIHPRFLQALEEGDYRVFSSPVHLKGFLKNYAEYLGLDVPAILAFWRREYDEARGKKKESFLAPLQHSFNVTPGVVLGVFTFLAVLGFFIYLLLAYRSVAAAPDLELESPGEDMRTASSTLKIAGRADPEATLTLNGQRLFLSTGGRFEETLRLSAGANQLNFTAISKLGTERKISRTVILEEAPEKTFLESTPSATPSAAPRERSR